MFDAVLEAEQAVSAARGRVLKAYMMAAADGACPELCEPLMMLERALAVAQYLAGKAHAEALAVKVTRSHSTAAPKGGAHGA